MTAPVGLTVGPRVMGQAAYDAAVARLETTGNLTIGSKVTGPLKRLRAAEVVLPVEEAVEAVVEAPVAPAAAVTMAQMSVADGLKAIRAPGADIQALYAEEMARPNGPRATLVAEFARRGVDPDA